MKMKIVKIEFPYNSGVFESGRLTELLDLEHKLKLKLQGWKCLFNPTYKKRIKSLLVRLKLHLKWYARHKFSNMKEMSYIKVKGGWLFLPYEWSKKNKWKLL